MVMYMIGHMEGNLCWQHKIISFLHVLSKIITGPYCTRSNFRGLKLSRISQIRDFRVYIFVAPHPVPLFFLFKLTSERPE